MHKYQITRVEHFNRYHRIKKKAEQRAASKVSIEELKLKDPEKAAEELEKMDRIRAEVNHHN